MRKQVIAVSVAVVWGVLQPVTPVRAQTPVGPDLDAATSSAVASELNIDRELEAARSWLELSLVDYESARLRSVQVALISPDRRNPRTVALIVCGVVNSRNRMGGYTGFQSFWFASALPEVRRGGFGPIANDYCGPANRVSQTDYSDRLMPEDGVEGAPQ